jgi:excisionase family DNA binding protein
MAFTLTTSEAAEALRVSTTTLRRLRDEGVLVPGIHYRSLGLGIRRPPLVWDENAVDQTLSKRSKRLLT